MNEVLVFVFVEEAHNHDASIGINFMPNAMPAASHTFLHAWCWQLGCPTSPVAEYPKWA